MNLYSAEKAIAETRTNLAIIEAEVGRVAKFVMGAGTCMGALIGWAMHDMLAGAGWGLAAGFGLAFWCWIERLGERRKTRRWIEAAEVWVAMERSLEERRKAEQERLDRQFTRLMNLERDFGRSWVFNSALLGYLVNALDLNEPARAKYLEDAFKRFMPANFNDVVKREYGA